MVSKIFQARRLQIKNNLATRQDAAKKSECGRIFKEVLQTDSTRKQCESSSYSETVQNEAKYHKYRNLLLLINLLNPAFYLRSNANRILPIKWFLHYLPVEPHLLGEIYGRWVDVCLERHKRLLPKPTCSEQHIKGVITGIEPILECLPNFSKAISLQTHMATTCLAVLVLLSTLDRYYRL